MRRLGNAFLAFALLFSLQPAGLFAPSAAGAAIVGGYYGIAAWPDGAGAFASAVGVAVDAAGNVYVADTQNHRIKKLSSAGAVLGLWGTRGTGSGQFRFPEGVTIAPDGRVFVTDTGNHRVQVFDSGGTYLATWGGPGTAAGTFQTPTGIAADSNGNLYVSDTANGRIQKFSSAGAYVATIGAPGVANGQLGGARGVAVDATGFIYAADMNNRRVQKFSSAGAYVTQWGPTYAPNGTPTGSRYVAPVGIAVDSAGYVYVADSSGHFVERCSNTGASAVTWGSFGTGSGQFSSPAGVVSRPAGGVYVADTGNNRIETLSSAGAWLDSWSGRGSDVGELDSPADVAGASGQTFVADTGNNRIQIIDSSGSTTGGFGSLGSAAGRLNAPRGIAVSSTVAWIADTGNNRIQTFSTTGTPLAVYGAVGTALGQYSGPQGIAVEAAGTVLVADTGNNRIQRLAANGTPLAAFGSAGSGSGQFNDPCAVGVASDGSFYVVDRGNNRVQKFSSAGAFVTSWGGWGIGDGQFKSPSGVSVDNAGQVYVTDPGNARIQRFEPDGTFVAAFGSSGAALGSVNWPLGVDVDASGRILVAERDNHRVQLFGYDGTAPITSRSGTPAGYDFAWVNSPVTVTLAPADASSGVVATYYRIGSGAATTYTAPFTISAQGQSLVRYWSVDALGNTETVGAANTFYVRIDSIPPSGTFTLNGGAAYATSTTVLASSAFTDAVAMRIDPATGTYGAWVAYGASQSVTLPGTGLRTVRAQFQDGLGNVSTYTDSTTVDLAPPVSTITGVPSTWATSTVNLGFSALDDVSGVAQILVSQNGGGESATTALAVSTEGTNTITYRAIDNAGHAEETRTVTVLIDTIAPSGTLALAGGAASVNTATVSAASAVTGALEMRFNIGSGYGAWQPFSAATTLTLPGDGPRTVTAQYRDQAGLTHTTADSVLVDHTAPVTTVTGVPIGWTNTPVTLNFSALDDYVGVDRILVGVNGAPESARTSLFISAEGTTTVTYRAIDLLGNAEETRTVLVRLDSVAPFGTFTVAGGAPYVTTTSVQAISAITGAQDMRFDLGAGWGAWQPFETTSALALPGEGTHVVRVEYIDEAGLTYETSATLTVDMTVPLMGSMRLDTVQSWQPRFQGTRATVSWSATDANGIAGYSWAIDRSPFTVPDQVADGLTTSLRVDGRTPGVWYLHVRALDQAGLWGTTSHLKVTLAAPLRTLQPQRDASLIAKTGRPLMRPSIGVAASGVGASTLAFEPLVVPAAQPGVTPWWHDIIEGHVAAPWWPTLHGISIARLE